VVYEVNELIVLADAEIVLSDSLFLIGAALAWLAQVNIISPQAVLL